MDLRATYFDGRSARGREVRITPAPGELRFAGDGIERRLPLTEVDIGERLGRAPRVLRLREGGHLELSDHAGFADWLAQVGQGERAMDLAQRSWGLALAAVALVVVAVLATYRWGLPVFANAVAQRIPAAYTEEIARQTLQLMDGRLLRPSTLDPARRAAIEQGFARLARDPSARLLFRSAPGLGANALALPDGHIVLLDELVALSADDDPILAVLAHELAHVERRHALRQMVESTLVGAAVAWWVGDFSTLLAAAPAALLQARNSRALEAEADAMAAETLRAAGMSPALLADMLEKIAAAHGARHESDDQRGWLDYLASHPATQERIEALRNP